MTTATPSRRMVRTLTMDEAHAEITKLLDEAGMTREELQRLGDEWELDAGHRGILSEIEGLEFLLDRAAR
ncbi:hypothetical protein [Tomitella cavernea]|uniref:Uncharacterized protein n=1 Tax=Tomitella cavernea TaxID=1387982 RepID=A0ABP9CGA1_9ACTN|nr:hypothetical protein [Tomitella cavernea]